MTILTNGQLTHTLQELVQDLFIVCTDSGFLKYWRFKMETLRNKMLNILKSMFVQGQELFQKCKMQVKFASIQSALGQDELVFPPKTLWITNSELEQTLCLGTSKV